MFEGRKKERIVEFEEIRLQAALAIPSNRSLCNVALPPVAFLVRVLSLSVFPNWYILFCSILNVYTSGYTDIFIYWMDSARMKIRSFFSVFSLYSILLPVR